MSAARNVAANVRRLRREKKWTQAEAAHRLHRAGGPLLTKASWSALERSAETDRVRAFTADEIASLASVFSVSVCALFAELPALVACPRCEGSGRIAAEEVRS